MAKLLVKIELIGLVNILAGEEVIEELVQGKAQPDAVVASLRNFIESPVKRVELQARLAETTARLGGLGAHKRAASAVASWFK